MEKNNRVSAYSHGGRSRDRFRERARARSTRCRTVTSRENKPPGLFRGTVPCSVRVDTAASRCLEGERGMIGKTIFRYATRASYHSPGARIFRHRADKHRRNRRSLFPSPRGIPIARGSVRIQPCTRLSSRKRGAPLPPPPPPLPPLPPPPVRILLAITLHVRAWWGNSDTGRRERDGWRVPGVRGREGVSPLLGWRLARVR